MGTGTVISVIIAIAVAAGASILFHEMDKSNSTMRKVGDYADKRIKELDAAFAEVKKEFNRLCSELSAKQTQANAAVKVLEKQTGVFKEQIKTFDDNISAVQHIEAQVSKYSSILNELNDMTSLVEENLLRIKKESGIVDSLTKKISEQERKLEHIDNTIPQITSKFNTENKNQLEQTRASLLEEYEKYAKHVTFELNQAKDNAADLLKKINTDVQGAFDSAASRADELESTAFQHLSEQAETRANKYITELNRQNKEIENKIIRISSESDTRITKDVQTQLAEIEEKISSQVAEAENNLSSQVGNLDGDISTQVASLDKMLAEKISAITDEYNSKFNSSGSEIQKRADLFTDEAKAYLDNAKQKMTEHVEKMTASFSEKFEMSKQKYEDQLNSISGKNDGVIEKYEVQLKQIEDSLNKKIAVYEKRTADVDTKVDTFDSSLNEKFEKYTNGIKTKIDAFQNGITESLKKVTNDANVAVSNAEETVKRLQTECEDAINRAETITPELNEKIQDVDNKIEQFRISTQVKVDALSKSLGDDIRNALADSETRRLNVLEDAENQLRDYKKELEYKINQLQTSSADVDILEKSLRAAMSEVQNRVRMDFDQFTGEQKKKHDSFAQSLKENSSELETKVREIEEALQGLKDEAIGSMSSKISEFEVDFRRNLTNRGDQIDDTLADWMKLYNDKMESYSAKYEDARKEIEESYTEKLKTNLQALQTKTTGQLKAMKEDFADTKSELQMEIDSLRESLSGFKTQATEQIESITENTNAEIKSLSEKNSTQIGSALDKFQEDVLSDVKTFEESIRTKQETSASSIDATISEFNAWKQQIKQQFVDSSSLFSEELENIRSQNTSRIHDVSAELKEEIEEYNAKIVERQKEIEQINNQNRTNQNEFVTNFQNSSNEMLMKLNEISKQIDSVTAQMGVYDQAEQMKRQLDGKIADIEKSFDNLARFEEAAKKFNSHYTSVCRMNDEVVSKMEDITTKQGKMESLEQRFNYVMELSGEIDGKIRNLNQQSDDLTGLEARLSNFKEAVDSAEEKMERLEKKDEVIETVNRNVTKAFDSQKDIDQRITDVVRQLKSLPQEIKSVQTDVDKIMKSAPKINDLANKLDNVESLIEDTDKRIETLSSAVKGMKTAEFNLQQLNKDIDNKFNVLRHSTQESISKTGAPKRGKVSPQDRNDVRELKRQGWSIEEIAKHTGRSIGEVDMMLELPED